MVLGSLTNHEECFFSKRHSLREAWEQFHRNPCPDNPQTVLSFDLIQAQTVRNIQRETQDDLLDSTVIYKTIR